MLLPIQESRCKRIDAEVALDTAQPVKEKPDHASQLMAYGFPTGGLCFVLLDNSRCVWGNR